MNEKGLKLDKGDFTIEVKYSDEAIQKKLVKFTVVKGNEIVLTADELISMMVNQVNSEVLSAAFVETDRVNVVEVMRGEAIRIDYTHPYPIEFAIIEEGWKIAMIDKDTKVTELTAEYLELVKKKIQPKMIDYMKKFYKSLKTVNLDKKGDEAAKKT